MSKCGQVAPAGQASGQKKPQADGVLGQSGAELNEGDTQFSGTFEAAFRDGDAASKGNTTHVSATMLTLDYVGIYVKDIFITHQLRGRKRVFFLFHIPCG